MSFISLDLVEAQGGSGTRISWSSAGTILASVTLLAWMERSVALVRETLCLTGVGEGEVGPQGQDFGRHRHLQH
jgi:hypothetical protein